MIEVFFRFFLKIFLFFSFLIYVVFFVVLGYRFSFFDMEKKDSFLQLIGWYHKDFINIRKETVRLSDNGEVDLFYMGKGCYTISFSGVKKNICLDSNQYVQYLLVKDVRLKKVNFIDKSKIDYSYFNGEYYNNCVYSKCFDENIFSIYKLRNFYIVNTYSKLYLCSYKFDYCKVIFDNMKDKYIVDFTKKGIYLIDKNSNLYLLEIR